MSVSGLENPIWLLDKEYAVVCTQFRYQLIKQISSVRKLGQLEMLQKSFHLSSCTLAYMLLLTIVDVEMLKQFLCVLYHLKLI